MNKRSGMVFAGVALVVLLVAGCVTRPTQLERAYGTSYHAAIVAQTLHPEAAMNLAPVQGFDGKAATHTLDRYRASFEEPPPAPAFVLSVGEIE